MLRYDMDARGTLSRYEYLYRRIRDDIIAGGLAPDDKLPSKRALAEAHGVSVVTAESAYAQLVAEGYVCARPRSGYYVAAIPLPDDVPARLLTHGPAQADEASAAAASEEPHADVFADFSQPATHAGASAAELWGKSLRAALAREPADELFAAQPQQGNVRLREAIARYLRAARGMAADAAHIVVAAGANVLYDMVALLVGSDACVALEDPGYPRLAQTYAAHGLHVAHCALDADGIAMADVEASGASLVHIMPSHQFPTGQPTSIARRYELLGWAARGQGRFIVEDDYDWEFRLAGKPIPPLASIDAEGQVIYISTFSKSLSSAVRVAFAVLPDALLARYRTACAHLGNTVSSLDQIALARLMESGDYERHVNRYRTRSRELRDALAGALRSSALADGMRIEEADSGLHFVLALDAERSETYIAERARSRGLLLAPLSGYASCAEHAARADGLRRFVMQYDGVEAAAIGRAVEVLEWAAGS